MKSLWKRIRSAFVSETKVRQWRDSTDLFFVLAIGRSGTTMLANLLDKADDAYVVHEPVDADFQAHQRAFHDPGDAKRYIEGFRAKEMCLRASRRDVAIYGEVNSVLRRHCDALRSAFPDATLIHLVRDGRDVVRSMFSNQTMTPGDVNTAEIRPRGDDPWRDRWGEMSRFERLCWYWMVENRFLRKRLDRRVRLEDLVDSYDVFRDGLLEETGVQIPRDVWVEAVDRPKNVTSDHTLPHWTEWSDDRREAFREICGDELDTYGYRWS